MPFLEEAWDAIRNPKPPALRVWADGKKVADDAGWLVVANSRQYALRLDFIRDVDHAGSAFGIDVRELLSWHGDVGCSYSIGKNSTHSPASIIPSP
jgi:hypothetical protein